MNKKTYLRPETLLISVELSSLMAASGPNVDGHLSADGQTLRFQDDGLYSSAGASSAAAKDHSFGLWD